MKTISLLRLWKIQDKRKMKVEKAKEKIWLKESYFDQAKHSSFNEQWEIIKDNLITDDEIQYHFVYKYLFYEKTI